jgi:predicted  nucleic acid-binding Zn-ribbon protein
MHPHLKALIELQAVDLRLIGIRERLARFPKRLAEVEAGVTSAKQHVTAAKEAHTTGLKERKTYEMDVEQWKERAKKYRNQSAEVKTNEAYKALLHEIQNAENEVASAEDRQL